jgi:hypothetical protein
MAGPGPNENDPPRPFLSQEPLGRGLGQMKSPQEIYVQQSAEIFTAKLRNGDLLDNGGIGNNESGQTQVGLDVLDPVFDLGGIGHVDQIEATAPAELAECLQKGAGAPSVGAIAQGYLRAPPGQLQCASTPNVTQGAADDRYLTG